MSVAEWLKPDCVYTIEKDSDVIWFIRRMDNPNQHAALRVGQKLLLSNIPKDLQQELGLKEAEEVQITYGAGFDAVLQLSRRIPCESLGGRGILVKKV